MSGQKMSEENVVISQRRETTGKLEAPTRVSHSKEDRIQTEKKYHWSCYRARKDNIWQELGLSFVKLLYVRRYYLLPFH